jgi:hypothetical protein
VLVLKPPPAVPVRPRGGFQRGSSGSDAARRETGKEKDKKIDPRAVVGML